MVKIHIIIPAYNEEKAILDVIKRTLKVLKDYDDWNTTITVIDDGSRDRTLITLKESNLPIKIIQNKNNSGKGYTLRRGFDLTNNDEIVVTMDADGEHHPEDIPNLVKPLINKTAHVVIGSRFLKDKKLKTNSSYLKNQKQFSHFRKFGNFLFSVIIWMFYRRFITDTQSGFRAFAPGVVKSISINSKGFEIETEILIKILQKGFHISECWIDSGVATRGSHMNIIFDSLKILKLILELSTTPKMKKYLGFFYNRF